MVGARQRAVKHAQRESLLQRELSVLMQRIVADDPRLQGLYISRVSLSPDRGSCTIFLATTNDKTTFEDQLRQLVLYKPSLRTALARAIQARRVPELLFRYDTQIAKRLRIEALFEQLEKEKPREEDSSE